MFLVTASVRAQNAGSHVRVVEPVEIERTLISGPFRVSGPRRAGQNVD